METEVIKMIKQPSYRFAGYTEPWEEKKLGEVAEVNPKSVVPDEFKYVDLGAVVGTEMVSYRNETISTSPSRAQRLAIKGDIFYQTVRPYQKNNYLFEKDDNDYVFSTGYAQLRPSGDGCFLLSYLQTNKFVNVVLDNCTGTSYPAINSKDLSDIFISLPSLSEQTAIGSFFQDIDQLISLQQRKLEVLKEQKKTYLKLLFPAKGQTKPDLRFAGFEDDWKEVKLGEVFDIVTDYVANGSFESLRNNVKTYEKDNFAYMIRLQDASNSWRGPWLYTDEKGYNFLSKSRLFKDDILMSNVGTVGRFFQVPELDRPMTLAPNSVLIRSTSSNNQFLYFMMLTPNIQDQITMRKTPGVQDKINKTDFKKVIATLPSLPEQEVIGSFFQDLDKAIAKQEEKVNQLKESKQTFLKKMFI